MFKAMRRVAASCLALLMAVTGVYSGGGIRAEAAAEKASVTYDEVIQYSDYGLGSFFTRNYKATLDGDTAPAYCLQPSKYPPGSGSYTVTKKSAGSDLAKVLYYGSKASDQAKDNYFDSKSYKDLGYGSLGSKGEFIITHLAASKANGSDDWDAGASTKAKKIVNNFFEWLDDMPAVPDTDVWFTSGGEVTTSVNARSSAPALKNLAAFNLDGSTDRWSAAFSVRCAEAQTITMTLPEDTRLVQTDGNGTITKVSGYGATITGLNKDAERTSCYLMYRGLGTSNKVTIKGSTLTKSYTTYKLSKQGASSDLQDLGVIIPASDGAKETLIVKWGEEKAKFAIEKREQVTGNTVDGAVYGLYSDKKCTDLVAKFPKTGTSGKGRAVLEDVVIKQEVYYIKEISAPEGTALSTKVYSAEPIDKNASIVWDFSKDVDNQAVKVTNVYQYGSIKVYKKDADTKNINPQGAAKLTDARYALYADADIKYPGSDLVKYKKGQLIKEETVGIDFEITFSGLLPGEYFVKETYASTGYMKDTTEYKFRVRPDSSDGQEFAEEPLISYEKVILGDLSLYKFRESEGDIKQPLRGITFRITSKTNGKYWEITTDEDGFATTEGMGKPGEGALPFDTYLVEEVAGTPAGLKKIDPFTVEISLNQVTRTYFLEDKEIKSPVTVVKKDATTGKIIPAANTEFELLDAEKNVVTMITRYPNTVEHKTFKTDESGSFTFPEILKAGTYYLRELNAPEGYLRGELLKFEVTEGSDFERPLVVEYKDKPAMGQIHIQKTDSMTQEVAKDAVYEVIAAEDITTPDGTVRAEEGSVVDTITTNESGRAVSKKLYLGKYVVKEIAAPDGFLLDRVPHEVTLEYQDQDTAVVVGNLSLTDKPTELKIIKKKAGTDVTLQGVKFKVWNTAMEDDTDGTGMVQAEVLETDENGEIHVWYLIPGAYCVQEVETLAGYVPDDTIYGFMVAEDGTIDGKDVYELSIENEYTQIIKTTAMDQSTETHDSYATDDVKIVDTVEFHNLVPGKEYTVKGSLMNKETGFVLMSDDKPVMAETSFVAEESDGSVEVEFTFNAAGLETKQVVVFEELYVDGVQIAVHADLDDEGQTIGFLDPEIGTTAQITGSELKESYALNKISITDTVEYTGLLPEKEYEIKGILMDQETGKPVMVDGEEITSSSQFTADNADGTVDVEFIFDASALAGKKVVVFESLYFAEKEIAVHADINDEGQTIQILSPQLGTTAKETTTDHDKSHALNKVTISDVVEYTDVIPGKELEVRGIVMDAKTNAPLLVNGEMVTAAKTFIPEKASGSVEMTFTFDASAIAGKQTVVFEEMYCEGQKIAVHADIKDKGQTVEFLVPEIGTTAKNDDSGTRKALAVDKVKIVDTVTYRNLIPGLKYEVKGTLMLSDGELLLVNGKPVTTSVDLDPESENGSLDITFEFDATGLEGKNVVVFEDLYFNGQLIGSHADLKDEGQTIEFLTPSIHTSAKEKGTDRKLVNAGKIHVVDTITYHDLIPGKKYTVVGVAMDKSTGKEYLVDGKPVTKSKTFTAEKASGTVDVEFSFDVSGMEGKEIVFYEKLYYKDTEIAVHEDINDQAQTIKVREKAIPVTPGEGGTAVVAKTGDDSHAGMFLLMGSALLLAGVQMLSYKKKKEYSKV